MCDFIEINFFHVEFCFFPLLFFFCFCSQFDRSRRVVILLSFDLFYWVTLLFLCMAASLFVLADYCVCEGVCVCVYFCVFVSVSIYFCWLFQCGPLNCLHLQRLRGRLSRPIGRWTVYTGCLRYLLWLEIKIGSCALLL